jgi:hypothetical protein
MTCEMSMVKDNYQKSPLGDLGAKLAGGLHHWVPKPKEAFDTRTPTHYKAENS